MRGQHWGSAYRPADIIDPDRYDAPESTIGKSALEKQVDDLAARVAALEARLAAAEATP